MKRVEEFFCDNDRLIRLDITRKSMRIPRRIRTGDCIRLRIHAFSKPCDDIKGFIDTIVSWLSLPPLPPSVKIYSPYAPCRDARSWKWWCLPLATRREGSRRALRWRECHRSLEQSCALFETKQLGSLAWNALRTTSLLRGEVDLVFREERAQHRAMLIWDDEDTVITLLPPQLSCSVANGKLVLNLLSNCLLHLRCPPRLVL